MSRRGRIPDSYYALSEGRSTGPTRSLEFEKARATSFPVVRAGVSPSWDSSAEQTVFTKEMPKALTTLMNLPGEMVAANALGKARGRAIEKYEREANEAWLERVGQVRQPHIRRWVTPTSSSNNRRWSTTINGRNFPQVPQSPSSTSGSPTTSAVPVPAPTSAPVPSVTVNLPNFGSILGTSGDVMGMERRARQEAASRFPLPQPLEHIPASPLDWQGVLRSNTAASDELQRTLQDASRALSEPLITPPSPKPTAKGGGKKSGGRKSPKATKPPKETDIPVDNPPEIPPGNLGAIVGSEPMSTDMAAQMFKGRNWQRAVPPKD